MAFTSTNAAPAYGKQYIRFAETFTADPAVAIGEFRAVRGGTQQGIVTLPGSAPTTIIGVNQAFIPLFADAPASPRLATVATSGLLLIEVDPASAAIVYNTPLLVNAIGQASASGTAVSADGTIPTIREVINIGGRRMVTVSFS
jgi:hypothetical protein